MIAWRVLCSVIFSLLLAGCVSEPEFEFIERVPRNPFDFSPSLEDSAPEQTRTLEAASPVEDALV